MTYTLKRVPGVPGVLVCCSHCPWEQHHPTTRTAPAAGERHQTRCPNRPKD